jgi:peptidoglycan-associated lipoprotein
MGARILKLMVVMVLVAGLSGCGDKKKEAGAVGTGSEMNTQQTADNTGNMGGPVPGTEQDLVVNVGDRVFFGYDSSELTPEGRSQIERQAQWLKTYPAVNVMVEGHCDERGTREYNLALGEKRATAVRNYLVANGVQPTRVQTISYGKERPAVLGADETSWAQNRRGVLVVQ